MRKIFIAFVFCLSGLGVFGQKLSQQSLTDLLSKVKDKDYIAVEGYYVDNSSFMVTHSSDAMIEVNKRYPVYVYKAKINMHSPDMNTMTEVPILTNNKMQGIKNLRVLFLSKKQTTRSQLVIDENSMLGVPIVDNKVQYTYSAAEGETSDSLSASDLREYLFYKGSMPSVQRTNTSYN